MQINLQRLLMANTMKLFASATTPAELPLTEQITLRFVVGSFESWQQMHEAMREFPTRGLVLDSFNCLASQRLFTGKKIVAPDQSLVAVEALPFSGGSELVACTAGPLANCLKERIASGAQSLKDALGPWLIPRHAAHIQDVVQAGKILLWIRIYDAADERCAFQVLLAHSSDSVSVHDITPDHGAL
jgi:hypothetical protein